MQFSMCSCFCHTSNVCVYRISIFAKNSRKTLQKSRFARFCKLFSRNFCKYFDPIHTHIFSVAKAFTQTKLHSSENKVPSSILHLIVENTITLYSEIQKYWCVNCILYYYCSPTTKEVDLKTYTESLEIRSIQFLLMPL